MTYNFTEEQLQWLDALESGDYEQGKAYLCIDNKYCCLGVASKIFADKVGLVITKLNTSEQGIEADEFRYKDPDYKGVERVSRTCAPKPIINLLKLKSDLGSITRPKEGLPGLSSLANMNDMGYTFIEIAKFIRENPEKVFRE